MIQKIKGALGVAYISTLEERVIAKEVVITEEKKVIKKPLVPDTMELKAWESVRVLLAKAILTTEEANKLAQLKSFIKTSFNAKRLTQD